MSFRFRFAAILDLRCRQRDEAGVSVGQALEAISRVDQQIIEIEGQRETNRQRSLATRTGQIAVDGLLAEGRYDMQLEAEVLALRQTLTQLRQELKRRQDDWVAAQAEVKRFERLEANDRADYIAEQNRRELLEADDATSRKYAMKIRHDRQLEGS